MLLISERLLPKASVSVFSVSSADKESWILDCNSGVSSLPSFNSSRPGITTGSLLVTLVAPADQSFKSSFNESKSLSSVDIPGYVVFTISIALSPKKYGLFSSFIISITELVVAATGAIAAWISCEVARISFKVSIS